MFPCAAIKTFYRDSVRVTEIKAWHWLSARAYEQVRNGTGGLVRIFERHMSLSTVPIELGICKLCSAEWIKLFRAFYEVNRDVTKLL